MITVSEHKKNKLKTPGYFIKRLKDNDFVTLRIFDKYKESDPRRWTVLVDQSGASVYITCFENHPFKGEYLFNFSDGNQNFKGNFRKLVTIQIPDEPNSSNSNELKKIAVKNGFNSISSRSIHQALNNIPKKERCVVVIFGSLYLAGYVLGIN